MLGKKRASDEQRNVQQMVKFFKREDKLALTCSSK